MDVAVEDQHLPHNATRLQLTGRHGRVVEHAIPLAPVGAGVMGAPGEARGHTVFHGRRRSVDRGARAPERPFDEGFAPGKPDPPHLTGRKRAREDAAHVAPIMHPHELVVGRRMWLDEFQRFAGRRVHLEPTAEERVFVDRKPVAIREWQRKPVAGK